MSRLICSILTHKSFKSMAVSAKGLQISGIVIAIVSVYVVYVQLASMLWFEITVLTIIFFIKFIRITKSPVIHFVGSSAPIF